MHKQEEGEGEGAGRGEDSDLCRTVQNTADELDQLLHGLHRLPGQEVLLIGCVEDDNGGHRHLAGGHRKTQLLISLTSPPRTPLSRRIIRREHIVVPSRTNWDTEDTVEG